MFILQSLLSLGDLNKAVGKMAQQVKCLPHMREDLSSAPRHPGKKLGMAASLQP